MPEPEILLKTQQVATALGVGVSTIKRWVDLGELQATRTAGKHRLISLREAFRFAVDQGYSTRALERLASSESLPLSVGLSRIDEQLLDRLTEALQLGHSAASRRLILEGYAAGRGAVRLGDDLIRPVMERIGHGWQTGNLDVFQEHEATQIILSTLVELIARISKAQDSGTLLALGASTEGDYYSLPGMLVELLLREQGWDVRNLGCNLPLRSLAAAIEEYAPRLVFLSVNFVPDVDRFIQEYSLFYKVASRMDVAVMLGGRALGLDLRSKLVFAGFGDRMAHLGEFARRLIPASAASSGLGQSSGN